MSVRIRVLGCRAGRPDQETPCSGYLVSTDAGTLLVDCGPGVLHEILASGLERALDGVVLTHLHQDHMNDIVPLAFVRLLDPDPPPPVPLWVPEESMDTLRALDDIMAVPTSPRVQGRPLEHAFDVRPLRRDGVTAIETGIGLDLVSHAAHHAVASAILAFTNAEDDKVVFSSDTGWCDALFTAAQEADALICEATFIKASRTVLEDHGHLTAALAGQLAKAARVRRLILTHIMHHREEAAALEAACAEAPTIDVSLAHPGLDIVIT